MNTTSNEMVRCPHCGALVHRHPEDPEQYCVVCHRLFRNGNLDSRRQSPPPTPGAIIVRIGTGGEMDERHAFASPDQLREFLATRAPELTAVHLAEILASPDTQFERHEMITDDGINGYWGCRRYEIEVAQ